MKIPDHEFPRVYWTRKAVSNGINIAAFNARVDRYGWPMKKAATQPLDSRPRGRPPLDPNSIRSKCDRAGIGPDNFYHHRKKYPDLEPDQLIEKILANRKEWNNRTNILAACREHGISPATYYRRLAKHGDHHRALTERKKTPSECAKLAKRNRYD